MTMQIILATRTHLKITWPCGIITRVNHIKNDRMLEASCRPFSTCVRGTDTMSDHTTRLKICPKCDTSKPTTAEYFHRDRHEPDGFTVWCKVCRNGGLLYDVPLPDGYKLCPKCEIAKPATTEYFHRHKGRPDGLTSHCKLCLAKKNHVQYIANKESKTKYNRQYYAANKEQLNKQSQDYYAANREQVLRQKRSYNTANQERKAIYNRAYNTANRKRLAENLQRWRAAHREVNRAMSLRYWARKRNAEGTHTAADIERQYTAQKGKCYYCHKKVGNTYHVDHVIPLSRGGSNGPENIVIACVACNTSKQDRLPHEWPKGGRLL